MNEDLQDSAALYALGALSPEEAKKFEFEMAQNVELRTLTSELEETVGALGALVPPVALPPQLKDAVLTRIRAGDPKSKTISMKRRQQPFPWSSVGWGLAAAFAVSTALFWNDRHNLAGQVRTLSRAEAGARTELGKIEGQRKALEEQAAAAKAETGRLIAEIENLKKSDALSKMQIATLQSSLNEYKEGVAVVVWDSDKGQGVLKLEKMPPVDPQKDYQLWVVDPKRPSPVDAGIVRVDEKGFARVQFKPVDVVTEAAKFALSVEKKGGVSKVEGPIILISP